MTSCVGTGANSAEDDCFHGWALLLLLLLLLLCCCCCLLFYSYISWRKRQGMQPYTWVTNLKWHHRNLSTYEVKTEQGQESVSSDASGRLSVVNGATVAPLDIDLSNALKPLPPLSDEAVSVQQKSISTDSLKGQESGEMI